MLVDPIFDQILFIFNSKSVSNWQINEIGSKYLNTDLNLGPINRERHEIFI